MVFAGGIGFLISYLLFGNGYVGLIVFLLLSGARAYYSYRFGDRTVLRQSRARAVTHDEEPRLHNIVEGLILSAGIPKPAVDVVLAIIAIVAAPIIQLAMSRRREYLADAQGAMLTRYPPGLASALRKIAADTTPMRVANNATGHLWLNQPSRVEGEANHWWENLFSTHPPIQERIRILEQM